MPYDKRYFLLTILIVLAVAMTGQTATKHTDIIIFSPHPDDATLCCAGLIQQSLNLGKSVHVVDITDGDGFLEAAAALSGKSEEHLTPRDMIRLGETRRKEELRAMYILGLSRHNVTFLGYPDGWLEETYHTETPFTDPYTKTNKTVNGRLFFKASVISDIATIITSLTPKAIYITDSSDGALDHRIGYAFVADAIRASDYKGKFFTYIIHTPEEKTPSAPPKRIQLSDQELQKKREAIGSYVSQLAVEGEYLLTFVTRSELFW